MSEPSLQGRRPPDAALRKSTVSTLLVMGATFLSRILGFVRIAVISALFGAGGEADVLNAVFNIPNNLRKLLAEGALSSAFIPVLSASLVSDTTGETARRVVRNIISFQLLILLPLLLVSTLFAEPVVRVILNFSDPDKIALSADLFRWLIHYLLLISISAVLMGVLNSHGSFGIPSFTPILFSVAVIAALLLLHRRMGVYAMIVGVLSGGVLQILFQYSRYRSLGYDFRPDFRFGNGTFRRVMRQWLPVVTTASVFTLNQHVAIWFATGLAEGSASAMSYAIVFWQLPFGIFSASVTTVLFPRMSRQAAANDSAGLGESLQYGLRFLLVLLIPSAVGMGILGREIIAVALQRGEFGPAETALTASVLAGYCWGLFSVGAFTFLQRFFYSLQDFRTPLWTAVVTSAADIVLSLWLKDTPLGVVGLAIANSVSFSLGFVLLLVIARRRAGIRGWRKIAVSTGKIMLALIPMLLFVRFFLARTGPWWMDGSGFRNLGLLSAVGVGSVAIILGMYLLLRVEMIRVLFTRRIAK